MNEVITFMVSTWETSPSLVRGILILLAGWVSAFLIRTIVLGILAIFRFDQFATRVGLVEFLRNGNVINRPSKLISRFVYQVVILISFLVASRALDIAAVNGITDNLVKSLPAVSAAIFILLIGIVVVAFFSKVLETIVRNTAMTNVRTVVIGFRVIGYGIIFLLASDQLGFGKSLLSTLLLIAFGAVALGFAIAFGLGSVDIARASLEKFLKNLVKTKPQDTEEKE